MAGRIAVQIERSGVPVAATGFALDPKPEKTGLVLHGETSAFPRGLAIGLRPLTPGTKEKFADLQRRRDWVNPRRYELEPSIENGKLILALPDGEPLPEGRYEVKIRIGGMKVKPSFPEVDVPSGGDGEVTLREKVHRRLRLNRDLPDFDAEFRRILGHTQSRLDGAMVEDWLTRAPHRDKRKAVLLNVLSKLRAIPTAKPADSLSRQVEHVFFAEIDRVYCTVTPRFHELVQQKLRKDTFIDSTHARLLTRIPGHSPDEFVLESYRERMAKGSLQAVVAIPKNDPSAPHYVDLDIDGANPGMGLVSFLIHFGEILDPDATNHLKLVKKLDKTQVGDFLYYDVERV